MANIDKAEWHYGGNYPADLPAENGGTHIGMFLAWIVSRGLSSGTMKRHAGEMMQQVLERRITGRTLLFEALDEKFFEALLNKRGKEFVRDYYETNSYITDYDRILGGSLPSTYHVADTWENYDKLAPVLNDRFDRWERGEKPPIPPKDPALIAHEEAQSRYFDALFEASKHLRTDSAKSIELLERYIAGESNVTFKAAAEKELRIVREKYGRDAT